MTIEDYSDGMPRTDQEATTTPPDSAGETTPTQPMTLRTAVEQSMARYFEQLDGDTTSNLYALVMNEVEGPLLEAVLRHAGSNQSKASIMLGLNRGTLRKKMKQHGLL